ncbi:biofilm development regulator YmgB/AriR family protein [Erwinia persicina]
MSQQLPGAGRAITDYFNSPSFHAPKESELLEAIMMELMQNGKSPSNKAIIANVIARLEHEADESVLEGYRNLLAQILDNPKGRPIG